MAALNLEAGWYAILIGLAMGTGLGIGFHRESFLGGYTSWPRRMLRLAHVSLVGLGLLNLAFAFSVDGLRLPRAPGLASILLVVGAITMPLACSLAAFRPATRRLFFVPVLSLLVGIGDFVWEGILR